ncbi:glycosyltransferase [Geobacillus zalihae]|uniref:glycosyltransferase n=2 Tax=Anoxybacillaceae TaxID=3120669 RepID=UPI00262B012D|nr:glycosyltransferase [Geobacillus zalihae]WKA47193.1 glycosyltransferase [Geobacillus zalihae]
MDDVQLNIIPELQKGKYIYENNHKYILNSKNIGDDGENLTIVVLSLNRSALTIRLMHSIRTEIPNFKGDFLIIDNGSDEAELKNIKNEATRMPFNCKIIELNKNYGVAGGRNLSVEHVRTDWIMFLDNDIYFIGNPLSKIQEDISMLGCHFLNLPLLNETGEKIFAYGGHLYFHIINQSKYIGGGSVYRQEPYPSNKIDEPFLSTFLFGGASVLNKHTFQSLGKFDDRMFIGFEDIDFSLRIFKNGYKIGNCGILCLVHDHPKPSKKSDVDYEKERFSRNILKESAEYFEKKHGIKVWNDHVDEWLKEKKRQLGLDNENEEIKQIELTEKQTAVSYKRPRIALIVDTDNWAFANISKQLVKHLDEYFEFRIIPMSWINNITQVLLLVKDYDLIHFFWRPHVAWISSDDNKEYLRKLGISYNSFYEDVIQKLNISTCIYDHLFLEQDSLELNKSIFNLAKNYYVCSDKLYQIYKKLPFTQNLYDEPLEDGVDTSIFKPINISRFSDIKDRKIVIGWCGNSKWADHIEDFKGVHTILKPAIQELIDEGYPIEINFADRSEKMIPHEEMPNYYSKIDLYICTSKFEGTPNPVLEAMACGVPVISTDVGIVPNVFGTKQKNFIMKERSKDELKRLIKDLLREPGMFKELSEENLESIKEWDWSYKTKKFKKYFIKCLNY